MRRFLLCRASLCFPDNPLVFSLRQQTVFERPEFHMPPCENTGPFRNGRSFAYGADLVSAVPNIILNKS